MAMLERTDLTTSEKVQFAALAVAEPEPRIVVTIEDTEQGTRIEISNNGLGIPDETLPRIFDPFFTTKDVGKGTGLGLSITHGIVHRHGGEISVRSGTTGTTFTLDLPAAATET